MLLLLCGCATFGARSDDELYQDLGGQAGVESIVDAFLERLADDRRVAPRFADTDIARFRRMLIEQLCSVSGGPCTYTGDSMRDSHAGLDIRAGEFDAVVEDLIEAMQDAGVPVGAQNRLLARLAPMREDIVGR